MQPEYEDLDDLDEGGFNWMLAVVLLLAVAGFFSLAWYAYHTGTKNLAQEDVMIIRADDAPVRMEPEDPGGREFPHQDKTIYDTFNRPRDSVKVAILPEDEEPDLQNLPSSAPQVEPEPADKKVSDLIKKAVEDMQMRQRTVVTAPEVEPEPKAKRAETPSPAPVKMAEKPAAPTRSAASLDGGEQIQLGAFRSQAEAEAQWKKLSSRYASLLKGKSHRIIRADLGSKGVFYRLRAGGYASKAEAKSACSSLSAQKVGCFVVR